VQRRKGSLDEQQLLHFDEGIDEQQLLHVDEGFFMVVAVEMLMKNKNKKRSVSSLGLRTRKNRP
jgi:hypothetical protein